MLAMPKDKPIHIESLKWQVLIWSPTNIGSIGITLTNGNSSPMFTGLKKKDLQETKEIKINQQI